MVVRAAQKKSHCTPGSLATSYVLPSTVGQVCGKHGRSIHHGVPFDSRVQLIVMDVIMAIAMRGHHYSSCVVSVPGVSAFRVASRPAQPCLLSWLRTCAVCRFEESTHRAVCLWTLFAPLPRRGEPIRCAVMCTASAPHCALLNDLLTVTDETWAWSWATIIRPC